MLGRVVFLVFACGLLVLIGVSGQDDADQYVIAAQSAYDQGNYDVAIEQYTELLTLGVENANLYFNLGNAYYESGQLGYALAYYLKSQVLAPRDSTLQRQIWSIRAERVDYQRDPEQTIDRLGDVTRGFLTLGEAAFIGFISWLLTFGLTGVWIVRRSRLLRSIVIIGAIVAVVFNGLLFARLYGDGQRPRAVVIRPTVSVLSGPGDTYLELYTLYDAAEMRIIETEGIWMRFVLPDGREGWLPRDVVVMI